jgi:hypothetical protein
MGRTSGVRTSPALKVTPGDDPAMDLWLGVDVGGE